MRMPWTRRPAPVNPAPRDRVFLTDPVPAGHGRVLIGAMDAAVNHAQPVVRYAQDADGLTLKQNRSTIGDGVPDAVLGWYASQGFIGHQVAAYIAQHWLVDKACRMPANDAVRHGFAMSLKGVKSETQDDEIQALHKANVRLGLNAHLRDYVGTGRVFGVRLLIFKVESTDPMYYEYPFNPDAVTPGSYQGMVQVDPYWCAPEMDTSNVQDPAAPRFYQPTYWIIGGRRYHHTHLAIFRTSDVPTLLRPIYQYGGVPVPQRIYERVYAAERTANEAPMLAMTKRLTTYKTDLAQWIANADLAAQHMLNFIGYRDNYGVKVVDTDDEMTVQDTTLADMDALIMTQYQLVAAAAQVPATKLLGTTPKGFNATGEYEEASYHEELETIQENDLTPVVQRHIELVCRSELEPRFGYAAGTLEPSLDWNPVDSPTAEEAATTRKTDAEVDDILVRTGAIDGQDVRSRIAKDKSHPYAGLPPLAEPLGVNPDDPLGLLDDPDPLGLLGGAPAPAPAADAAPRPLYVSRPLVNVKDVRDWAKSQGLTLAAKPHVTIMRSRAAVDWMTMGETWEGPSGKLTVEPGGARIVEHLGDKGAVVLLFNSSSLAYRHRQMLEAGASWDFADYQPHLTITYDAPDLDLSAIEPYRGKLVFGPEVFAEFVDGWRPGDGV